MNLRLTGERFSWVIGAQRAAQFKLHALARRQLVRRVVLVVHALRRALEKVEVDVRHGHVGHGRHDGVARALRDEPRLAHRQRVIHVDGHLNSRVELQVVHRQVLHRAHTRAGTPHRRAHVRLQFVLRPARQQAQRTAGPTRAPRPRHRLRESGRCPPGLSRTRAGPTEFEKLAAPLRWQVAPGAATPAEHSGAQSGRVGRGVDQHFMRQRELLVHRETHPLADVVGGASGDGRVCLHAHVHEQALPRPAHACSRGIYHSLCLSCQLADLAHQRVVHCVRQLQQRVCGHLQAGERHHP
mmetsp:Transcript_35231/g.87884  ORF Transcript_35231/g.87884 Transcript_35231/m.87884 type:complete len:298 (-) Transcript_35231:952-1845(-)